MGSFWVIWTFWGDEEEEVGGEVLWIDAWVGGEAAGKGGVVRPGPAPRGTAPSPSPVASPPPMHQPIATPPSPPPHSLTF